MTELDVRKMLVGALKSASVFGLRNKGLTEAFLSGGGDLPFDELEMDSLGAMELCIAVELNTGIEIVPEDLQRIGTLGGLVAEIRRQQA